MVLIPRNDIDGLWQQKKFLAYTLEDEQRDVKVYGETRIPAGTYKLKLREEGGFHNKYLARYGADWHHGMIWVQDVPNLVEVVVDI